MPNTNKYIVVESMGKIKRDVTSYGYQFSIEELESEKLLYGFDLKPYEGRRVKVLIMLPEEET